MAKAKAAPAPAVQTIACPTCGANVNASEYVEHVKAHANAVTQPPPVPRAEIPAYAPPPGAPAYSNTNAQGAMQPIQGPIDGAKMAGGNYLKGSDVPDGHGEVRIRIKQFVLDPRGRSKLVAAIDPPAFAPQKTHWGLNTTNIRALVTMGFADLQQVVGRTVVCMVGMAPNPQQNGALTKTLFVQRVE